jgi:stage IV sporulation protein FB
MLTFREIGLDAEMWKMHEIIKVRGVVYSAHGSFMAIFAVLGLFWLRAPDGALVASYALVYFLINACILLHELGHVVFGKAVGLNVGRVSMSPLGCVAVFDDDERCSPRAEAIMTVGGPLVTFAICAVLYGLNGGIQFSVADASVVEMVFWGNMSVLLFNMLPIYPLDGGALLNALARACFSEGAAHKVSRVFSQGTSLAVAALAAASGAWVIFALALFGFVLGPQLLVRRQ